MILTTALLCAFTGSVAALSPEQQSAWSGRGDELWTTASSPVFPVIWGFPKIRGTFFGGPNNKDHSILGSILGSPILRNYHILGLV